MVSGGARIRSGPPPDPNALRRDRPSDKATWRSLPAGERVGEAPAWPLEDVSKREAELWSAEWRRPQAVVWEERGYALEVALYVRSVVAAESPKATASDRALPLRFMEDLGISSAGLARNRWRIDDAGNAAPTEREPEVEGDRDARRRADLALVVG
jgi:hypothetical protein